MHTDYGILILSYNHPDLTERCISSVLATGLNPQQITLVHNGSEQKFVTQLQKRFPQIQHLASEKNLGFTGGCNFGFSNCFQQFENVFFLTNDTEVIQLPLQFPRDYDLFSPLILKRKTEKVDSIAGALNTKTGRLRHLKTFNELKALSTFEKSYIPGTAFGLTKACFQKVGLFDTQFHTYWEDVDYSLRASNLKCRIGFVEEFKLRHKIGKTCHKDRFYTLYLFQRNRRKLMHKHAFIGPAFLYAYSHDMLRILIRLLAKPEFAKPLRFWWRALYE